jgi:hypothetical protein
MMASPSCEATQPPTPISTAPPRAFFSSRQRPSCENTFSCAFSRIEQVLTRMIVGVGFVLGQFQAVFGGQHVGHLGRVVLVHLATVGLDVQLAWPSCGR